MTSTRGALFLSVLVLAIMPSRVGAQASLSVPPAPPATTDEGKSRDVAGNLGLEILGAVLGNSLGIVLTSAVVLNTSCFDKCDGPDPLERNAAIMQLLRPALVGGGTFLLGRASGGDGRGFAAVLGSVPGTAAITASFFSSSNAGTLTAFVVGHVLSMTGAVAAYRYSARRRALRKERTSSFMSGVLVDRHSAGLSLSKTF